MEVQKENAMESTTEVSPTSACGTDPHARGKRDKLFRALSRLQRSVASLPREQRYESLRRLPAPTKVALLQHMERERARPVQGSAFRKGAQYRAQISFGNIRLMTVSVPEIERAMVFKRVLEKTKELVTGSQLTANVIEASLASACGDHGLAVYDLGLAYRAEVRARRTGGPLYGRFTMNAEQVLKHRNIFLVGRQLGLRREKLQAMTRMLTPPLVRRAEDAQRVQVLPTAVKLLAVDTDTADLPSPRIEQRRSSRATVPAHNKLKLAARAVDRALAEDRVSDRAVSGPMRLTARAAARSVRKRQLPVKAAVRAATEPKKVQCEGLKQHRAASNKKRSRAEQCTDVCISRVRSSAQSLRDVCRNLNNL